GKFAAFMQGPWGIALTAGAAVLLPFLGNLLLAGNALDAETEKLKKNAEQTEAARKAKEAFGKTEEGVRAAILDQKTALDKQDASLETAAEKSLR
ncbi:hypothetical protein ACI4CD_28440, partial [Klebsiella pneumoniae]|uniref:hypothetical protein n=1 Tax=Klebsiella pneumoniae TaxID=573 RepID=UPI0038523AA7